MAREKQVSLSRQVYEAFGIPGKISQTMAEAIDAFYDAAKGEPRWLEPGDDLKTLNFGNFVASYAAALVCLDVSVKINSETERGQLLQRNVDYVLKRLRENVQRGLSNVGIMFKPNGVNVDYIKPGDFVPLEVNSNGDILACAFKTTATAGKYRYTRWEYHHFANQTVVNDETGEVTVERVYRIDNRAFRHEIGGTYDDLHPIGDECDLSEVPQWRGIERTVIARGVDRPLYAYFRNPAANTIDEDSCLGVPVWFPAAEEIAALDYAWSRKDTEVADSKHVTYMPGTAIRYADKHNITLPRMVTGVEMGVGVNADNQIHEHVSTLLTDQRIKDINADLSLIGIKCGFGPGRFKLDREGGYVTATEIEAGDQDAIETVKTIRDALKDTLTDLIYACDKMADNIGDTLPADYSIQFGFGDITYNYDEDRARWLSYVSLGMVTPEAYLQRFENMSEQEAVRMVQAAKSAQNVNTDMRFYGEE